MKIHFLQKEIDNLKKQLDHNEAKGHKELQRLQAEQDKQHKMMKEKSVYSGLPNALSSE